MVEAGEIMVRRGGSINPAKFPEEVFDLLSIPSYDKQEIEILAGSEIGSSKSIVAPGDVLLSKIIPHIRRCWIVPENRGRKQIGSGEWIIFRDARFHPPFLKHFLMCDIFHAQFMNTVAGVGGSLVRARPAEVERIKIPLPPLAEQKRIAAILDKADAIRRKRQQAIQLADDFLRAVFLEMFGDPVTNPKGWEVRPIKAGIKSITSGWSANGDNRPCEDDELGVLKISAVTSGKFIASENKAVLVSEIPEGKKLVFPKKGDMLFSRANTRELVAASCIVLEDSVNTFLPDKLWSIKTDDSLLLPEYFNHLLKIPGFKDKLTSQATGSSGSMLNISMGKFEQTECLYPPINLQAKFKELYWKLEEILLSLVESNQMFDMNFNSLSQKAFSGQL
jgi:type I restriction enzyme S subunit